MQLTLVTCSKCKAVLPREQYNAGFVSCPTCASSLSVMVFPALVREAVAPAAEQVMVEGEASCFYHPQKKAALPCDSCGRFLCALCDVELGGQHLCPACLDSGKKKGKLKSLENQRVLYDRIALTTAVLPMLFVWTSIIGAPVALFISIRYWNSPGSILGRSKARFVIAIILGVLQIAAWIAVIIYFTTR
ncbi:MAG: hypothetical protein ABIQ35_05955 [Verrucomicrobiota bacterium]